MQGIRGQAGGGELGVESVVGKGDGHEMKDRTHCRTCTILVKGDGFPFTALSALIEAQCARITHGAFRLRLPLSNKMVTSRTSNGGSSFGCKSLSFTCL